MKYKYIYKNEEDLVQQIKFQLGKNARYEKVLLKNKNLASTLKTCNSLDDLIYVLWKINSDFLSNATTDKDKKTLKFILNEIAWALMEFNKQTNSLGNRLDELENSFDRALYSSIHPIKRDVLHLVNKLISNAKSQRELLEIRAYNCGGLPLPEEMIILLKEKLVAKAQNGATSWLSFIKANQNSSFMKNHPSLFFKTAEEFVAFIFDLAEVDSLQQYPELTGKLLDIVMEHINDWSSNYNIKFILTPVTNFKSPSQLSLAKELIEVIFARSLSENSSLTARDSLVSDDDNGSTISEEENMEINNTNNNTNAEENEVIDTSFFGSGFK